MKKASTYIYKAFAGDYDFAIDEAMQNNVSRHNLLDMLTFDRVDFEKNISLSAKKKVKIESKFNIVKIGQIAETHSVSAGMDYPGVGPEHAWLKDSGRAEYVAITDQEALKAFHDCCQIEGIIPALETAHAFSVLPKMNLKASDVVVVCLSGRGDKDLATYMEYL